MSNSHCGGVNVLVAHTPLSKFLAFPKGPRLEEFCGFNKTAKAVATEEVEVGVMDPLFQSMCWPCGLIHGIPRMPSYNSFKVVMIISDFLGWWSRKRWIS